MKQVFAALLLSAATTQALAGHSEVINVPVESVSPILETVTERIPHEICRNERVRVERHGGGHSATPAIMGAVVGGALGSVLGDNSRHRGVITGAGALLGASVGHDVGHRRAATQVRYVTEEVCDVEYELREQERLAGYRVSYRFGDKIHEIRTDRDPGATIAVRVTHQPLP
jgi:uncharacterized protein YcfJ